MKRLAVLAFMMASAWSGAAYADEPCDAKLVCASNPKSIVTALQDAGYKAVLSKSESTGNPMIESAASGYDYTIFFYECDDGKNCGSLQFQASFSDDGANNAELANKWNSDKRFSQMSVDEDKSLGFAYDVTTVGGLNKTNFADVLDWWALMLGEVSKFFKENPAPKK
jgi:hypothetical protein